jgi:surface protein
MKRFRLYQDRIKPCVDFYFECIIKNDLMTENDENEKFIIGNWDVSRITDMGSLFLDHNFTVFNKDLGNWDVSNVTNMEWMFGWQDEFDQDLSKWNVGNVTNMGTMFAGAKKFNQDLSKWNVENVTNMEGMFTSALEFNQDLSSWIVSKVTNMNYMFSNAKRFSYTLKEWGEKIPNNISTHDMFKETSVREVPDWVRENDK